MEAIACPKCTRPVPYQALACPSCGYQQTTSRSITEVEEEELFEAYIGPRWGDYYQRRFRDFVVASAEGGDMNNREARWHPSWNWAALIGGFFWFGYRKIYKPGFGFFGGGLVASFLLPGIGAILFFIAMAVAANYFVFRRATQVVGRVASAGLPHEQALMIVAARGGVQTLWVWLGVVLSLLLVIPLVFIALAVAAAY